MEDIPIKSPVQELIDHGLLSPPVELEGVHHGTTYRATIEEGGTFVSTGEKFGSPSVAAGHVITKATGQRSPGRRYLSVNGWRFWGIRTASGQLRTLADLRKDLPSQDETDVAALAVTE